MDELFDTKLYKDIKSILLEARNKSYMKTSYYMINAYWQVGKNIVDASKNKTKAKYGAQLLKSLSEHLTVEFGKGYDESNLRRMRSFYLAFKEQEQLCLELSWSHYRQLMRIKDVNIRLFYIKECVENNWSVRQLERQISSFYYERLLSSQDKDGIRNEIKTLENNFEPKDIIKDPYVLEFVGLKSNSDFYEKDLETALIDNLQEFLLELGKGFSFIGRQQRITAEGEHFYVDLVFYNYLLKCFVLIDLKLGRLTHQDIGQMDFYVRYYEDKKKVDGDNPTIGIILSSERNDTIVKYSILDNSNQLFASKYMLYIPTEDELKQEIERERHQIEKRLAENLDDIE